MDTFNAGDTICHNTDPTKFYKVVRCIAGNVILEGFEKQGWWPASNFILVKPLQQAPKTNKPSGGPSSYYDFPFKDWVTVNDMIEYLSEKQWGKHSWIFKDIVKACTRWGSKDGTTHEYDAKKIIYYGARLLMSVADKATLRTYLQELLDDKQFKENNND